MRSETEWWRGATIYQIYPRSFQDTNGDGVGDLNGITSRLDYVAQLGADAIWISPFVKSPMKDFGYDVSDYCAVDPLFGDNEDFRTLLEGAHARRLKVILDQVWSHTSSEHPWFQESRQARNGEKADWYVWADAKPDGSPPNNWQAWFGGPAWTWEPRRRQYYLHNFLPSQPNLNARDPAVKAAIKQVARFWLDMGVDGFRVDAFNYLIPDKRLRDNPPSGAATPALPRDMQIHEHNSGQPETLAFAEEIRETFDQYDDRLILGELVPGSPEMMKDYTRGSNRLHTAYSFELLGDWPGVKRLGEIIGEWGEGWDSGWPCWALSNHDVQRTASRWRVDIGATESRTAALCLVLLTMLRGTIVLYQGEELGLPQAEIPFEELRDPWGVAGWPQNKGRDGCRTPMPWKDEPGGEFTTGKPWLPLPQQHLDRAAIKQSGEALSVLNTARALIGLRQQFAALRTGSLKLLQTRSLSDGEPRLLAFAREGDDEAFVCAINFGPESSVIEGVAADDYELVLGDGTVADDRIVVAGHGAYIGRRRGARPGGSDPQIEVMLKNLAALGLPG